jgi:hypothetical protein
MHLPKYGELGALKGRYNELRGTGIRTSVPAIHSACEVLSLLLPAPIHTTAALNFRTDICASL